MFIIYLFTVSIIYFFFLILSILSYLLIRKVLIIIHSKRKNSYYQSMYPKLSQYITNGENEHNLHRSFQPTENWKREVVIGILYQFCSTLNSDDEVDRIGKIIQSIGLDQELAKKLKDPRWWTVVEATNRVGKFRLRELSDVIVENLNSPEYDLWIASARALSLMNKSELLVNFLLEKETELPNWSIIRMSDILVHGGDESIDPMIRHLSQASPLLQGLFIDILGKKKVITAIPAIETYLFHEDEKFRLKALKAIGDIGLTNHEEYVISLLHSSSWAERLNTIHAVRNCAIHEATQYLCELVSDSNWWVRLRAAEALFSFGTKGKEYLTWASVYHQDRFARDMAKKVLQNSKFGVISS